MKVGAIAVSTMSEEQLSALLAKLKVDAGLKEKLKGVADLDAAVVIAKGAGFDVSKEDCLKAQASQVSEMSDEELAGVSGGVDNPFFEGRDVAFQLDESGSYCY